MERITECNHFHFYRFVCVSGLRKAIFLFVFLSFSVVRGFSQGDLASQFDEYNKTHFQEKLFVHTDKSFYLAGEILWFKVYAVDGILNQQMDLSKVAYVEIVDRNHVHLLKAKIGLKKGSGNGSFFLPVTLNTGNYILRAYTNWMKNFDPELYFEKTITVVNSLKVQAKPVIMDTSGYDIQFFPEGGSLVRGIRSKVGFRVAGRDGKGRACTGVVRNQNGEELASFRTLQFGLGQFYFTPSGNDQYYAELRIAEDSNIKALIPSIQPQGYVMALTDTLDNEVAVNVYSAGGDADERLTLFVNARQSGKLLLSESMNNHRVRFVVKRSALGAGISHFTIFNDHKVPLCERLYFKPPAEMNISISGEKPSYGIRQKIQLEVATAGGNGKPVAADMSVSVFLADSLQARERGNILSYLWLSSDLTGNIESPEYYFEDTGKESREAIENLMLTHGWRRFRWSEVLQANTGKLDYLPEYEGHLISGKMTDKHSGQAAASIAGFLSVRGINYQFNSSTSDEDGNLYFNMPEFYGNEEIIVQTNTLRDSGYRLEIANPFSDKFSSDTVIPYLMPGNFQSLLLSHSIGSQVQNAFYTDSIRKFYLPDADTNAFYGTPDKRYLLDDYTRFTSMEEILREYVAEVSVRRPEGKSHILVLRDDRSFNEEDPLILLDGVPYFNIDTVLHFDPLRIRKLEVMKRKYYMGLTVTGGVVSMTTYNGDLSASTLDPNAVILEYEGLQLEREFFSPVYETEKQAKSRLPDMRNVLYWSPDLNTHEKGKGQFYFYSSDQPGNYYVVVQGLSATGEAGFGVYPITIK